MNKEFNKYTETMVKVLFPQQEFKEPAAKEPAGMNY